MKKPIMILLAGLVILAGSFMAPTDAKALIFYYDVIFNGSTPLVPSPWLKAELVQGSDANTVKLTLTALGLGSTYIDQVLFNIAPTILPSSVTITYVSGVTVTGLGQTIQNAQDVQGAGQAGRGFDIEFNYPSGASGRLNDSLTSVYTLTYSGGLTPASFQYYNSSNGYYMTAAHIAGFGQAQSGAATDSGTTLNPAIPEPATMLLFGSGLFGVAAVIRRRFKK